jgi:hypothetical protein
MGMRLEIQMIETCSCNMMCPCWYGVRELMVMDQGWCGTAMALRFLEGAADGVDLGGRTVVLVTHFPGPTLLDGNATGRLYIDDGASSDQFGALEMILQAHNGGPMAVLASLVSKWLPSVQTEMDIQEEDDDVVVDVAGYGQLRSGLLRNDAGEQVTMHNAAMGLTLGARHVDLAPSASRWVDPDLPSEFDTRSGGRSRLSWVV